MTSVKRSIGRFGVVQVLVLLLVGGAGGQVLVAAVASANSPVVCAK
jgi:hypothetical protein